MELAIREFEKKERRGVKLFPFFGVCLVGNLREEFFGIWWWGFLKREQRGEKRWSFGGSKEAFVKKKKGFRASIKDHPRAH